MIKPLARFLGSHNFKKELSRLIRFIDLSSAHCHPMMTRMIHLIVKSYGLLLFLLSIVFPLRLLSGILLLASCWARFRREEEEEEAAQNIPEEEENDDMCSIRF